MFGPIGEQGYGCLCNVFRVLTCLSSISTNPQSNIPIGIQAMSHFSPCDACRVQHLWEFLRFNQRPTRYWVSISKLGRQPSCSIQILCCESCQAHTLSIRASLLHENRSISINSHPVATDGQSFLEKVETTVGASTVSPQKGCDKLNDYQFRFSGYWKAAARPKTATFSFISSC